MAILFVNRMNRSWERLIGDVEAILPDDTPLGAEEDIDNFVAAGKGTKRDFIERTKFWVVRLTGLSVAQAKNIFMVGEQLGWSHSFVDLQPLGNVTREEAEAFVRTKTDALGRPIDLRAYPIREVLGRKRIVGLNVPQLERRALPLLNMTTLEPVDPNAKENLHTHLRITRDWTDPLVQSRVFNRPNRKTVIRNG